MNYLLSLCLGDGFVIQCDDVMVFQLDVSCIVAGKSGAMLYVRVCIHRYGSRWPVGDPTHRYMVCTLLQSATNHQCICGTQLNRHNTNRADSRFAPSQWETLLRSDVVSHWLGATPESGLYQHDKFSTKWPASCRRYLRIIYVIWNWSTLLQISPNILGVKLIRSQHCLG